MVDLQMLRDKFDLTEENLKSWLFSDLNMGTAESKVINEEDSGSAKTDKKKDALDADKRNTMRNRIRSRIQESLNRNLAEGRHYYALDQAWDKPFRQISPTLLQSLMDKDMDDEEVNKIVSNWGLSHLLSDSIDPKTGKISGKKGLSLPIFFNVYVPLCKAYVTIRWAKIVNDRRLTPFFKYEPAKNTVLNKLKCEAITDRVQVMALQYAYFETMRQSVLKMLHYSFCIQFPKEEWHSESQYRVATTDDVEAGLKNDAGTKVAEGDPVKVITREGLRYHHPHPSRTIRDLNYPAYTLNTDSGCEYTGYWRIMRYRDLCGGSFWNTDKISIGATDLIGDNSVFFTTVYPCTMTYATTTNGTVSGVATQGPTPSGVSLATEAGSGVGNLDREKKLANQFYTTDRADQAVLVTEYHEKLIPKDNGLGDYDCPVWFRFVVAGDQATILYACPLPSVPAVYYGYDEDGSRAMNASMTLECLPFQDQFGNLLSQLLLSVKNNLANLVLIDEDQISTETIGKIQNLGEKFYRNLNVQGFSARKAVRSQNKPAEAVQSFKFPQANSSEIMNCMKIILDTLERVLVMSSQEVGQAASHEQTREEIRNIAQSSSSRQVFTTTPVDEAREAWKRQIYAYTMNYGDEEFFAHIPSDHKLSDDELEKLGFTGVDGDGHQRGYDAYRRVKTSTKATAMDLYSFASAKDGDDRTNDKETAQTILQLAAGLMENPITAQAVGADQAIFLANKIIYYFGLPSDIRLRNMSHMNPPAQQGGQQAPAGASSQAPPAQDPQAMAQEILKEVLAQVQQQVGPPIQQLAQATAQNSQGIALIAQALHIQLPHPADDSSQSPPPAGSPS